MNSAWCVDMFSVFTSRGRKCAEFSLQGRGGGGGGGGQKRQCERQKLTCSSVTCYVLT